MKKEKKKGKRKEKTWFRAHWLIFEKKNEKT